jgi:hypothetical protein
MTDEGDRVKRDGFDCFQRGQLKLRSDGPGTAIVEIAWPYNCRSNQRSLWHAYLCPSALADDAQ